MKFSLVMCTIARPREVERCIESLEAQSYRDFELIVADQSTDGRMEQVVARHADKIKIVHLKSPAGATRARNAGIRAMTGDVLALPDDDCVYAPDQLQRVYEWLKANPEQDGLAGGVVGSNYWLRSAGPVTKTKVWWQCVDFSLFLRRRVVDRVGLMNDKLGPGSGTPWGAGECPDYVLRCLKNGFKIHYDPSMAVAHPGPIDAVDTMQNEIRKAYTYSVGKGYVVQQHQYPLWYVGYLAVRPLIGLTLSLIRGRFGFAKLYWNVSCGVLTGYLSQG